MQTLTLVTSFHKVLRRARPGTLFDVRRRYDKFTITGFAVDFSDSLVLFHRLDTDVFCLNGYTVLRHKDVNQVRSFTNDGQWLFRAVRHYRLKPKKPAGISLNTFPDLVKSVARRYPLITLHEEKRDPNVCFIGTLVSVTKRTITIDDLNSSCEWSGLWRQQVSDITRVDFGDGYAEALSVTAPKKPRVRK